MEPVPRRKGKYGRRGQVRKPSKEALEELYIKQGLSTRDCGKRLDISQPYVLKFLNEYGIPVRSTSENGKHLAVLPRTDEWRFRISMSQQGNANSLGIKKSPHTTEAKVKISVNRTGKAKGSLHPNWKGGISGKRKLDMGTKRYQDWRKSVLQRDGFSCSRCGLTDHLQVHHIKPYAVNHLLRYDIDNGLTLCRSCHIDEHKKNLTLQYNEN